ncbi:MAG: hypothetical protein ACYS8L_04765, partial [Planctomycetota bacterium]
KDAIRRYERPDIDEARLKKLRRAGSRVTQLFRRLVVAPEPGFGRPPCPQHPSGYDGDWPVDESGRWG